MPINFFSMKKALQATDSAIRASVKAASEHAIDTEVATLNEVVKPWANKIVFRRVPYARGNEEIDYVMSEGRQSALDVFWYVDRGTEPHLIFPKRPGGKLAFNVPYIARTSPIANPASGSGKSGSTRIYSDGVLHPGNEPRAFIDYSMLVAEDAFESRLDELTKKLT